MRIKFVLLVMIFLLLSGCSASCERNLKNINSEWTGGLNRTVTVYSNDGKIIKQYSGRFDIKEGDNKVLFDLDGKRVIIYNGVVISEEEGVVSK
jgi:outer membrane biogenesis lipoprotein LolB